MIVKRTIGKMRSNLLHEFLIDTDQQAINSKQIKQDPQLNYFILESIHFRMLHSQNNLTIRFVLVFVLVILLLCHF